MVQGLVVLVYPNASVAEPWKTTLILYAFILLAVGFNIFCAQHLPLAEGEELPTRRQVAIDDQRVQVYFSSSTSLASSSFYLPSGSWQIMLPRRKYLQDLSE